jgi:hypothetical protein
MCRNLNLLILFALGSLAHSQVPDTDLWLFKIKTDKLKQSVLTESLNITNRKGYDNQPSFSADGLKIFYTSIHEDKQADVYYYDLKTKKNVRLTQTTQSEYSPVLLENEKLIASVVVENDSAQRINFYNSETGSVIKRFEFDSVGYYTFLNADTLIYYKLTEPHSLRFFVKGTGEDKWLGNSPIRTFKAIDRHTLIYGLKDSAKVTFFKYDFLIQRAEVYTTYNSLSEDVVWHPAMGLIKSEEAKLLRYDEQKKEWILLYDLSGFGIKKITRFIFDPKNKYLVVVNNL